MSRKLTISLLLAMLGLAGLDAFWGTQQADQATTDEVRATHDGAGSYPPD